MFGILDKETKIVILKSKLTRVDTQDPWPGHFTGSTTELSFITMPTGDPRLVALYCCLEPPTSHVSFKRSQDFNTSSSNNLLKTSSHSKILDQYNFDTQDYYYYCYNIVLYSLIIPQIFHTMLYPLKLLIHHNYKRILYYYKKIF